ncbi:MAG: flagellar brake protein, partial [Candidatus Paceibacterota bacterium]
MIAIKREVWLYAPPQPSFTSVITDVEEAVFWINLPRESGQILMLQENQNIKVRVYLPDGFYSAETKVVAIGNNNEKFYALNIPDEFVKTQDRRFVRARFAVNITFTDSGLTAHTSAVNFSTGGVMVYLVPELKKVL